MVSNPAALDRILQHVNEGNQGAFLSGSPRGIYMMDIAGEQMC